MSFIEEIKALMQVDENLPLPYKCIIYGGKGAYFENIKAIKSYLDSQIILLIKKGELEVNGKNLYIKKYADGDILIMGRITEIKVSEV